MNRDEFNRWCDDFATRFPSTDAWVEALPDVAATRNHWFDTAFQQIEYRHAMEASEAIQRGDYALGNWQEVPATYRRIAREFRLAEAEASRVREPAGLHTRRISCLTCRDSGLVMCWSVDAMRAARTQQRGGQAVSRWNSAGLPCSCAAGDKFTIVTVKSGRTTKVVENIRYDEQYWIRLMGDDEADKQALLDWAEHYRPANQSDFGEYSNKS